MFFSVIGWSDTNFSPNKAEQSTYVTNLFNMEDLQYIYICKNILEIYKGYNVEI